MCSSRDEEMNDPIQYNYRLHCTFARAFASDWIRGFRTKTEYAGSRASATACTHGLHPHAFVDSTPPRI